MYQAIRFGTSNGRLRDTRKFLQKRLARPPRLQNLRGDQPCGGIHWAEVRSASESRGTGPRDEGFSSAEEIALGRYRVPLRDQQFA